MHTCSRMQDTEWAGHTKVVFDLSASCREGAANRGRSSSVGMKGGTGVSELVFSANFEGGNLAKVTQVGKTEYDILLSPDTETSRHMQWFYFKVSNVQKGINYKLNLVNMSKSKSLYNKGLQPLTYSEQRLVHERLGWSRSCQDIAYYKSSIYYRKRSRTPFRTLTFTYTGEYNGDKVHD